MSSITEYGEVVFNTVDEWGRVRVDSLLEDGTYVFPIEVVPPPPPPPVVEYLTAMSFPMLYVSRPESSRDLVSKVSGASVIAVSNDIPRYLVRYGRAQELRSKWTTR
ncbi:MAG: hypothetical protein QW794_04660 [Thermosphaera sp.]